MRVLPNPVKEAANRRKHGFDFSRVAEVLANPHLSEADDRPLGYEHEGRLLITGRLGLRVMVLVIEPVTLADGHIAARPISLRRADPAEARRFWKEIA